MVNQNKIYSFKIKRQAKNAFPRDVERTVVLFSGSKFFFFFLKRREATIYVSELFPLVVRLVICGRVDSLQFSCQTMPKLPFLLNFIFIALDKVIIVMIIPIYHNCLNKDEF